jgi:aryl-alcohol dehydrogenase-like predicted oxidoreductase
MTKYCNFAGIGMIPWSALEHGSLARPLGAETERSQAAKAFKGRAYEFENVIIMRIEEIAKKRGWLMSQVALAWIGGKVTSPLIGVNSVSQLSWTGSPRRADY